MADPKGFLKVGRELPLRRSVEERKTDWIELYEVFPEDRIKAQASRCMDCGIPFCHNGCPLGNIIPDWNDLTYRGRWKEALAELHSTNNFPEFTGKLCPAPCESACVLGINQDPVAIRRIEESLALKGWEEGWIVPEPPQARTGKTVAVVGSGPSGLAAAQQLNRSGHSVTVFERAENPGGLLRYGIPDFKMEKRFVEKRVEQMEAEGIVFRTSCNVGVDISGEELKAQFDAIVLSGGSTISRDLTHNGRADGVALEGRREYESQILFAMDFLPQQNKKVSGEWSSQAPHVTAEGKKVVILGGGDTGADCLGTVHRQGATEVYQFEIMPKPPTDRPEETPWPLYPMIMRTSAAHEEGGKRDWSVSTKKFTGDNGILKKLHGVRVEFVAKAGGRPEMVEIPDSEFEIECDLVLLAMGFLHPQQAGIVEQLGLDLDGRGNVKATTDDYQTSAPNVFACGDMRRGQSLIVWAIAEGRECAAAVDRHLEGSTLLPRAGAVVARELAIA